MKIAELLLEGGWTSTVTQDVIITPEVAREALTLLPRFEKDFNTYLGTRDLPPIEIGAPVGSSAYIERDLKSNPTKEYGDIDVVLKVPRIQILSDARNSSTYLNAITDFIAAEKPDYLHADSSGKSLIVKTKHGWIQVDLVKSFMDVGDWAQWRFTPEHNLKGAVMGFLYSALAEVLHLSIGDRGVQAKEKDGQLMKFKLRVADKIHTFSTNIEKFGVETAEAMVKLLDPTIEKVKLHAVLVKTPGLNKADIKARDLANVIKGIALTLELNGALGKGHIKATSAAQLMDEIAAVYKQKIDDAAIASKFDKATTPAAKRRAEETKETLLMRSKEVLKLLEL